MTLWMKTVHRWIGLLIGVQLVLWMLSGLMMSLFDANKVRGKEFRAPAVAQQPWPADAMPMDEILQGAQREAGSLATAWLLDEPIYRLSANGEVTLFSARDGRRIVLDAALAQRLAEASYRGPGKAQAAKRVPKSLETRAHPGEVWQVPFSDSDDTTVYLSLDGKVLEHRNWTWRVFDIFWMLHIMDYTGRADFNNPLVVSAAIGGLWLALSGTWLLFTSFGLADFVPARWRRGQSFQVLAADGSRRRTVKASAGQSVFVALARQGLNLPSNCGGGQSCGLCEVRVRGRAPEATGADRALLSPAKLRKGHRLACNVPVADGLEIEIPGGAEALNRQVARVERVTALTPTLREIVLVPEQRPDSSYRPGSYIQIQVPGFKASMEQIELPAEHLETWGSWRLPATWVNESPVPRAYSLSSSTELGAGRIALLVRFLHGSPGASHPPPGRGSTYMYLLKPGDRVTYSGPFGNFALKPGRAAKIFVGGGAGMAPLRAMIQSLLGGSAPEPIHFWYGARTPSDAPFVQEMETLCANHANFHWHLVTSEPGSTAGGGGKGGTLVHSAAREGLRRLPIALDACEFYLCGPPPMLTATRKMLRDLGVQDRQVFWDDFKI
ncbi:2Fe-2S iron-sulfur cluster-binding protein [Pseudorhodoferax sp.]|uniref:2Fe-2S iron-sulfur cluster-binding protein n=1 Tax=Pseudorhodoferax sp. TaxID=1993553 RepID=UPI002DD6744C|nr:2Fe-2S iron-sulfur cluster-binding protein [Pseudorhodoferax sp.]